MTPDGILQAVVAGAAILASAGIAVWVPSRERKIANQRQERARLDVTTTRWPPVGLQLDISYRPEFTHVGLGARLTLLSDGSIKALRLAPNPAQTAFGHARLEQGSPFIGNKAEIPLVRIQANGPFIGGLILLPSREVSRPEDGMNRARVRVEVLTDGGEILTTATLVVTPIDEARSFWDA
jgi:hypothetical protein